MVLLCRVNSARSRLCEDSQEYTLYWPARLDTVPRKPDELYFLPENFGASDLLQPVSPEKLERSFKSVLLFNNNCFVNLNIEVHNQEHKCK